jgi:restriction system protein
MTIDTTFPYPPELMQLLVNVIPLLNRSKKDVFLFLKGAGVPENLIASPYNQWRQNRDSINKYEITRQVLTKLNERGEACIQERREILKRIIEFESFTVCWPDDQFKAKGLVSEIRDVVNRKDSFTRMNIERKRERLQRLEKEDAEKKKLLEDEATKEKIKQEFFQLFSAKNHQQRGKALESVLNRLFKAFDISVRESFTLVGENNEGIIEQIDGAIELDGHIYFVEMKWWDSAIGVPEVSQHLVRILSRAEGRAIIISASDFTRPAVTTCKEALHHKVVSLCTLHEIVKLLERKDDLKEFLRKKVQAAIIDKNPFLMIMDNSQ